MFKDEYHEIVDVAWDDVTGVKLDPHEVKKAREEEMAHVRKKHVWAKVLSKHF